MAESVLVLIVAARRLGRAPAFEILKLKDAHMIYRKLGKTGLEVSQLGFGAMRLPMTPRDGESVVDRELAIPMMHAAFEAGVNYIDSAVGYCHEDSQRAVGDALEYARQIRFAPRVGQLQVCGNSPPQLDAQPTLLLAFQPLLPLQIIIEIVRRSSLPRVRIVRLDQPHQPRPRNHRIHLRQEALPPQGLCQGYQSLEETISRFIQISAPSI